MFKKFGIVLALIMALTLVGTGCSKEDKKSDNSLKEVQDKGTLILGLDDSFPPMGYRDENGKIVGFDIDLAKEVAKRMDVELKLQPISWDAKVLELDGGSIDMIWNGLSITPEREKEMLFSKPYLNNKQIIVVAKDSKIKTKKDLADKKVGVQLDSSGQTALEADTKIADSLKEMVKFDTYTLGMMDLKKGGLDAVVVDEVLGRYVIAQDENAYKVLDEDFGSESYGIGFRKKDQTLRDEVQKTIDAMIKDGTAAKISEKWFGKDIVVNK